MSVTTSRINRAGTISGWRLGISLAVFVWISGFVCLFVGAIWPGVAHHFVFLRDALHGSSLSLFNALWVVCAGLLSGLWFGLVFAPIYNAFDRIGRSSH
jgi:hypothetical protein